MKTRVLSDETLDSPFRVIYIMTYLTNPNFVDHIIKSQGAEALFGPAEVQTLGLLIDMEARHLLETAFRFMDKDRRDVIRIDDVA